MLKGKEKEFKVILPDLKNVLFFSYICSIKSLPYEFVAALLSPDRTKESAASFFSFLGLNPLLSQLACLGFARLASSRHHGFIKSDEGFVFWKSMVSRSVTLQRKIRGCSQLPFFFCSNKFAKMLASWVETLYTQALTPALYMLLLNFIKDLIFCV